MSADPRAVVQGAALVASQRGLQALAGLCFAAVVPRLMGPDRYGRYAVITSLAVLFAVTSGIALTNATTRYMPSLAARGEPTLLRRLVGNLFTLRVASGAVAAGAYLLVTILWWTDLDPAALGAMAMSVWANGVATFMFALFLGLGRAAQSAVGETVRRWLMIALVVAGFHLDGLRGAALGVVVAELGVLALGWWWMPVRVTRSDLRPDGAFLRPYLRYGVAFLASQVLYMAYQGSGEALVRMFSANYAQVGYFGLAHGMYLAAATAVPQLLLTFVPMFSSLVDRGQTGSLPQWNTRFLRYLAIAGVLTVFGALFLADAVVRLLFGPDYHAVAANLVLLSIAFLVTTFSSVLGMLALVHERPGPAVIASGIRLAVFWGTGPVLVTWWGSLGGCAAVLAAVIASTSLLAWRLRGLHGPALRQWLGPVALGALLVPLAGLRASLAADVALYGVVIAAYGGGLLLLRFVTLGELATLAAVFRRAPRAPGAAGRGSGSGP